MHSQRSSFLRRIGAAVPLVLLLAYGLLVSSPRGEAGGGNALRVIVDPRLELAGMVGRLATDSSPAWPDAPTLIAAGPRLNAQANHPAVRRVRRWVRHGFTPELLAALLMQREPLPGLGAGTSAAGAAELTPAALGALPGAREFDPRAARFDAATMDSLAGELLDFATAVQFDALWPAAEPILARRAAEIEGDPTFKNLTARLSDFFGESPVSRAVVAPTLYGAWRSPFAFYGPAEGQVTVVDRAPGMGRLAPETSLSWACAREFARPLIRRIAAGHAGRIAGLAGYWDYFRQGVAATTLTGWEDCLNAHLFRAIDLRVRPQEDSVERELRISAALEAGLGMIRAVDGSVAGYDRGRGFYRRFADYFPTLLDDLTGLDARLRVQRPRLGLKTSPTLRGLAITEITPGYSAELSGLLKVGDVITAADGRPVRTQEFIAGLVQSKRITDSIELSVERDGAPLSLAVPLSRGRLEYEFFKPAESSRPGTGTPAPADPVPPKGAAGL